MKGVIVEKSGEIKDIEISIKLPDPNLFVPGVPYKYNILSETGDLVKILGKPIFYDRTTYYKKDQLLILAETACTYKPSVFTKYFEGRRPINVIATFVNKLHSIYTNAIFIRLKFNVEEHKYQYENMTSLYFKANFMEDAYMKKVKQCSFGTFLKEKIDTLVIKITDDIKENILYKMLKDVGQVPQNIDKLIELAIKIHPDQKKFYDEMKISEPKTQEDRLDVAKDFILYLKDNQYMTLEDIFIGLSPQINNEYVIKGYPWYFTGKHFHGISPNYMFMIELTYGTSHEIIEKNKVSRDDQVKYIYEVSDNIIPLNVFGFEEDNSNKEYICLENKK
jgi:hypothetical protein